MKKVSMIFAVIVAVAGLTSYAFADPGWTKGRQDDHRSRYERPYQKYDYHRDDRDARFDRRYSHRPVIVHSVPAVPPRPVVRIYEPPTPTVSLYFPNISIQIR